MSSVVFILLLLGIGILAGIISAAAGLASLVSYPSLLALGLPPVMANVTSAFSTITSSYSSVFSSFKELEHNRRQLWIILPVLSCYFPIIRSKVRGRWQETVNYLVNHGSANFYQSLVSLLSEFIRASLMRVPEC